MNRLILLALIAACEAVASPASVCGTAMRISDGELVYRELHYFPTSGQLIEYHDAQGKLIASNELINTGHPAAPEHTQRDLRLSVETGVRWQGDQLLLYRNDKSRLVKPRSPTVISAGFDAFVKENWLALADGKRIEFDFPLPNRLRNVRLAMQRIATEKSRLKILDEDQVALRIEAANRLLALFVDSIDLAYGPDRRLRHYYGLSNLAAPEGGALPVEISYNYADDNSQQASCAADSQLIRAELRSAARYSRSGSSAP